MAKNMTKQYPDLKIIFLTMHKSEEILAEAFESGAKGYVLKENAFEELIKAIHTVYGGRSTFPPNCLQSCSAAFFPMKGGAATCPSESGRS